MQTRSKYESNEQTTPIWLDKEVNLISDLQRQHLPKWIILSELPSIWINESILTDRQVQSLLVALELSTLEEIHPLVRQVKLAANRESLDAFVCKLFELWRAKGKAIKEKWAFLAMGMIGSDLAAHKLGPLVYRWRNSLRHQNVSWGLDCLKAIGTSAALMELHAICQKTRHTGLKERINQFMTAIAHKLNLSQDELQDRIIPTCGLDAQGSRIFDFGPRQFRLVLGPELQPMIKDSADKVKTNLPKPGVKDDASIALQSVTEWKLIKKQVTQVVKLQSLRLEQAMVNARCWPTELFEALWVQHPLMNQFSKRLIWAGYDHNHQFMESFRITEDNTYDGATDQECQVQKFSSVAIIHPLCLSADKRSLWGELLSDYEIIQPFAQLGRPLYHFESTEEMELQLTQISEAKIEAITLIGRLERNGWTSNLASSHMLCSHLKYFAGVNITAFVEYDKIQGYSILDAGPISVRACCFHSGYGESNHPITQQDNLLLPIEEVDAIVISEVLKDLFAVVAKAS
jgi:hypothetical protein